VYNVYCTGIWPSSLVLFVSDVNKANSVKAKQYKAKARGAQGQGLAFQVSKAMVKASHF